jgi:hypothetical protein
LTAFERRLAEIEARILERTLAALMDLADILSDRINELRARVEADAPRKIISIFGFHTAGEVAEARSTIAVDKGENRTDDEHDCQQN